jgi:hypothetical protein
MEAIKSVESLAKAASTLTRLDDMGTSLSQSVKSSVDSSLGLISSLILILNNSLGYSPSCETDVAVEEGEEFWANGPVLSGPDATLAEVCVEGAVWDSAI